jgi:FkbM family methyltransferase
MKLEKITQKVFQGPMRLACKLFGRDKLSLVKIKPRTDLQEIGTEYGGWVVPTTMLNSHSVCYCFGCGEDISFDLGLIEEFGCDVFGYDPTPRAIAHVKQVAGQNSQYHFFELGVWDKQDTLKFFVPKNPQHVSHSLVNLQKTEEHILVDVKRLKQIMDDQGHKHIDLLKIDIEGAEYRVIESIVADNLDIKIICVEYDECFNPLDADFKTRIRKSVRSLLAMSYDLVWAQGQGNYIFVKNHHKK